MRLPKNPSKDNATNLKKLSKSTQRVDLSNNLLNSDTLPLNINIEESSLVSKLVPENFDYQLVNSVSNSSLDTLTQSFNPIQSAPAKGIIHLPDAEKSSADVNSAINQSNLNGSRTQTDFSKTQLLDYGLNSSRSIHSPSDTPDHVVPFVSASSMTLPTDQTTAQLINSTYREFDILPIIRSMSSTIESQPQLHLNQTSPSTESKCIVQELSQRLEDLALKIDSIEIFFEPRELNLKPTPEQSARSLLQDIRTEITQIKGLASHIDQSSRVRTDVEQMPFNRQLGQVSENALNDSQTWVPMEEAAELLGITRRAVNRIVEKGHARTNTLKVPVQVEYEVEKTLVSLPDLFQYRENPPKGGRPRKDGLQREEQQQTTSPQLEQQYELFLEQNNQQSLNQW